MEIALIIVLLLLIALFFIRKQKAPKVINNSKNFKELVFIRIDASQKKKMHYSGRMLIADYPYMPSAREMKSDFGRH